MGHSLLRKREGKGQQSPVLKMVVPSISVCEARGDQNPATGFVQVWRADDTTKTLAGNIRIG